VLALPLTAPMANDRAQAQIRALTLLASWLRSLGRLGRSFAFQDKDLTRLDVRIFQKTSGEVSESIWTIASGILLWTTAIAVSRWELAPRKLPANRGRRPGQVVWLGYSIPSATL
jgi:hypothetical protein